MTAIEKEITYIRKLLFNLQEFRKAKNKYINCLNLKNKKMPKGAKGDGEFWHN